MPDRSDQNFEEFISGKAKNLPRHQPPEKMWDAIESRLTEEPSTISWLHKIKTWFRGLTVLSRPPSLKIASIGLAFAFAILFLIFYTTREQDPLRKIQQAEKKYIEAIGDLEKLADRNAENIDLTLWALYQERLNLLDESIAHCKQTLEQNNGNINAQKYLFLAYQEKVATLKKMARFKKGQS